MFIIKYSEISEIKEISWEDTISSNYNDSNEKIDNKSTVDIVNQHLASGWVLIDHNYKNNTYLIGLLNKSS